MFFIPHPACDTESVGFWRWSLYGLSNIVNYFAEMLHELAFDLEHRAIYRRPRGPVDDGDEIPF